MSERSFRISWIPTTTDTTVPTIGLKLKIRFKGHDDEEKTTRRVKRFQNSKLQPEMYLRHLDDGVSWLQMG
jgi:hypothetical protein